MENLDKLKYWINCPVCDNYPCVKGTEECEAEQWFKRKELTDDQRRGN